MPLAFILGRTPQLAQKEIEATATILPFPWLLSILQGQIALLKQAPVPNGEHSEEIGSDNYNFKEIKPVLESLQKRLGGTQKIVYLESLVEPNQLIKEIGQRLASAEGRVVFGVSVYGQGVDPNRLGRQVKKDLREQGISVRFIEPKDGKTLSTAQVVGNRLAGETSKGQEMVLIQEGKSWWLGHTVTVQDIESYRKRDFGIPVPDAVSGMLSPKLAQTMINLAIGGSKEAIVYDAFCGNGRVVEEARLMGFKAYGSDLREEQVAASRENMEWIARHYNLELEIPVSHMVWQQDATQKNAREKLEECLQGAPWYLVSEPYLGRPLRKPLAPQEEQAWLGELKTLYEAFFEVWAGAKNPPQKMIVVIPAAKTVKGWLPLLTVLVDRLQQLGYSFKQVSDYGRPDALVKRTIVEISLSN